MVARSFPSQLVVSSLLSLLLLLEGVAMYVCLCGGVRGQGAGVRGTNPRGLLPH